MKKILTLTLVLLLAIGMKAQQNHAPEYLLFEFMSVPDENTQDYLAVEQFWSGIHQQRVADKSIIGWDLWALTPSGSKQGSQFLTVTIFPSLKAMLSAVTSLDVMGYAKKAYPNKSEKELNAMMEKTVKSRDIAHQVLFKGVDETKDDFKMQLGTVCTLDVMKQLDDSYEKVESEIFKPWHQQLVDDGKKGHWGLIRTILPAGSTAYADHIAYSFYKDMDQLAAFMENSGGDMDMKTQMAVSKGLKTRDWKEMIIGKLIKMVR